MFDGDGDVREDGLLILNGDRDVQEGGIYVCVPQQSPQIYTQASKLKTVELWELTNLP
jgi:hypothetical protein